MTRMDAAAIAVVVASFDSEEVIDACLTALRAARDVVEIRVVDRGSRDATMEIVQRHAVADPRLRFIAHPEAIGLAEACNHGAAACRAPWLAFVDPGCNVDAEALCRLRDAAADGDWLLGPALVDDAGIGQFGAALQLGRPVAGSHWWSWAGVRPLAGGGQARREVDALDGAVLLMPRTLFARIAGCDSRYRTAIGHLDLCRRVRAAGARVGCIDGVRVVVVRGVAARAHPWYLAWHRRRDAWRLHAGHMPWPAQLSLWLTLPTVLLRQLLRMD